MHTAIELEPSTLTAALNPETSTRYHLVGAPMHTAIELEQTCIVGTDHVSVQAHDNPYT